MRQITIGLSLLLLVSAAANAPAAELRLRAECTRIGGLVLLGDVADIYSVRADEAAELATIELFPAPAAGEKRFVRLRELQDLLLLRGVNLAAHRISGASQVVIHGAAEVAPVAKVAQASSGAKRLLYEQVQGLIVQHLRQQSPERRNWQVKIQLDESQTRQLLEHPGQMSVSGGQAPWVGRQQFVLHSATPEGTDSHVLDADVTLPAVVVVATRTLPRGAIIHASDVQVQDCKAHEAKLEAFGRIEDVVGQEIKRSIGGGQTIGKGDIRAPLLVRNGDPVTVYSRSPGIQVRTTARACQEGALGELISVESFTDRRKFFARVSGVQEVEIFARAAAADTVRPIPTDENLATQNRGLGAR